MVYTTHKNGDDWGMVYDCFDHINTYTGWWFGTFFIFHNIWDNPSH
jgi:hypothetical protein